MNICIVGPSKQFFSGLTVHTTLLANALSEKNQVSVVLLRNLLPRFLYPGRKHIGQTIPLIDFVSGVDVIEGMDWNSPPSWIKCYRRLKQHKPEAIIMLWWSSAIAHMQLFLAIANKWGGKSKLILEIHEVVDPMEEKILPIKLYSRIAGRQLMRMADAYTVHSTAVREQVAQIYGIPENKILVKPFGLYSDYQHDLDKDSTKNELEITEQFVILCFGSIRKYKGVSLLVRAFSDLPESVAENSRLVIAGEDWGDDSDLHNLAKLSPYKNQITLFTEFVPDDMIPKYFSAADIVVLPYLRTSGSGVANIAMAYAKPIITSDLETMKELLANYSGAMFFTPGNLSQLTDRLAEVYSKQSSGDRLYFEPPQNTWSQVTSSYIEIIDQVSRKT